MKKTLTHKGFTLVETLVAITILILGITGTYVAVSQSISSGVYAKEQVVAIYLAQEGVEMVRNMRDNNGIQNSYNPPVNWLHGISETPNDPCYFSTDPDNPGKSCYQDVTSQTPTFYPCADVGNCPVMREDPNAGGLFGGGFYGYNPSDPATIYTREIHLSKINDHEVSVTVTVTWSRGIINRQFTVRENLFDWL